MKQFEVFEENLDQSFFEKDIDEINSIFDSLFNISKEIFEVESKKEKTKLIKRALVDLGHEKGYKVYANGFTKKEVVEIEIKCGKFVNKEWLYDIHWYIDTTDKEFCPEKLILACECEWAKGKSPCFEKSKKDIGYDFQKLLFSNAKYRLMITRVKSIEELAELYKYYKEAISNYKQLEKRAKFLFVCYCSGDKKMYYLELGK